MLPKQGRGTSRTHLTKLFLQPAAPDCTSRVTHQVSDYILTGFFSEFLLVAYLPRQFCQICSCQSRIRQTSELQNQSKQNVVADLTCHPVVHQHSSNLEKERGDYADHRVVEHDGHDKELGGPIQLKKMLA